MLPGTNLSFADRVQVRSTPLTRDRGLAGKVEQVYGETTPSVTRVEVIGELKRDYALNVNFDADKSSCWFTEELLEFVDHGSGTEIEVGTAKLVRSASGEWINTGTSPKKCWWKFW